MSQVRIVLTAVTLKKAITDQAKLVQSSINKFNITCDGDSNDAEHDAAIELRDRVEALLDLLKGGV